MSGGWERVTVEQLRVYRVLFAAALLVMCPNFLWLRRFPDALYEPPPGPMRLFDGFPPTALLAVLTGAVAVCGACLLLGVGVRVASWVLTGALLYGYGLSFSLGKIDHNVLLVLTPAVMVIAGWAPGARARPWVLQLWAFAIGVAMLTAALPKVTAGWLDTSTHAVRGLVTAQVFAYGQDTPTAVLASHVTSPWVWEPADWVTPLLEGSIVVLALLGLRWFRGGLALLTLFHLGVLFTMNIAFTPNVVTYGAFVSWPTPSWRPAWSTARRWLLVAPVAVAGLVVSRIPLEQALVVLVVGGVVVVESVRRARSTAGRRKGGHPTSTAATSGVS